MSTTGTCACTSTLPGMYFHIYTRELSLQRYLARESHPALNATESISCMREMGARRTFRLSGHCLQEGRQAFSFEAMYTIKQASVAGRLNAVLTPGTLFQRLEPVIILRQVIATGLAGVFPLPSATRFMSSKPALPRIWRSDALHCLPALVTWIFL